MREFVKDRLSEKRWVQLPLVDRGPVTTGAGFDSRCFVPSGNNPVATLVRTGSGRPGRQTHRRNPVEGHTEEGGA